MAKLTLQDILKKGDYSTRGWPKITHATSSERGKVPASMPDTLRSGYDHIDEAQIVFAKLADEYIPRGREGDIRAVVEALTEAKREVNIVLSALESMHDLLRPWERQAPQAD